MKWGAAIAVTALLTACGGDDGTDGAPGAPADPAVLADLQAQIDAIGEADAAPESCVICHNGGIAANGASHQAAYDEYYQPGVIEVVQGSMSFGVTGTTATLSFAMTKSGGPLNCTDLIGDVGTLGSYWAGYDGVTKSFPSDVSLTSGATKTAVDGVCTLTKTVTADQATAMAGDGIVTVYGTGDILFRNGAKHIT
ncbi:MAG: hypothetical protein K0B16_13605, partial [Burkholderiaceae bacterium]|nr:hypothetical protein [Burkholderiaceae bacterium]